MIKSLSIAKFAKYPSSGVYYCLPAKDFTHWILLHRTERDVDTGEHSLSDAELSRAQQYTEVVEYFQQNFATDISDIGRRCLPRGRILDAKENKGIWIILHGNDTPSLLRHQVISEFGLPGIEVKWQYDSYETTEEDQRERLLVRCPQLKQLMN